MTKETEQKQQLIIAGLDDLRRVLDQAQVPLKLWGQKGAKTPNDLFEEIKAGESKLVLDNQDGLLRLVRTSGVIILSPDGKRFMVEKKQIRRGQERERVLPCSMMEKGKYGEEPKDTALRGLREELEFTATDLKPREERTVRKQSPSYPGLQIENQCFLFETTLTSEDYGRYKNGFIRQEDKIITIWGWKPQGALTSHIDEGFTWQG